MARDGDELLAAAPDGLGDAALPTWATCRSTTERELVDDRQVRHSARVRARLTRNCSPFDRAWKGRSQAGGVENPTDESSSTTSLIPMAAGKPSRIDRSAGQSQRSTSLVAEEMPGDGGLAGARRARRSGRRSTSRAGRSRIPRTAGLFRVGATSNMPEICMDPGRLDDAHLDSRNERRHASPSCLNRSSRATCSCSVLHSITTIQFSGRTLLLARSAVVPARPRPGIPPARPR